MKPQEIKNLQEKKLKEMFQKEIPRHPYYREMLEAKGINASEMSGSGDLRQIPFTVKEDILPPDDRMHPWKFVLEAPSEEEQPKQKGGLLSKLLKKGEKEGGADEYRLSQLFYTSSRTGGKPVPLVFTIRDIENLKEAGNRSFNMWGFSRDDSVVNAFSFVPNISFWQQFHATMELGATALQTGGGRVIGAERIVTVMQNLEAQVLMTFPGYADFLMQSLVFFNVKVPELEAIVVGMEDAPQVLLDRISKNMEKAGAKDSRVYRTYFLSEAKVGWPECSPGNGYHVHPDHALVEIVDPETGEPKGEKEPGEIVVTNLDARGTVLLRFKSGDIATGGITYEPCPACGRAFPRILGDIDKKHYYYELNTSEGKKNLDFNNIRRKLFAYKELSQWYLEIKNEDGGDKLNLKIFPAQGAGENGLEEKLKSDLSGETGIPVDVENTSIEDTLNRIGMEKGITEKRIFDLREN